MSHRGQAAAQRQGEVVGITSRCPQITLEWLEHFLYQQFPDDVAEVRYLPITSYNQRQWLRDIQQCRVVILYHTKNQGHVHVTDVNGALYNEELQYLHTTLGRDKVLVVVGDMEDNSEEERWRILQTQPSLERLSRQLILIPIYNKPAAAFNNRRVFHAALSKEVEKPFQIRYTYSSEPSMISSTYSVLPSQDEQERGLWNEFGYQTSNQSSKDISDPSVPAAVQRRISIFSRAAESNYTWLVEGLKVQDGMESADIQAVCITNNSKTFRGEAQKCQFAILYHTLKHGGMNITDATNALYDQELQYLSAILGRENLIVVADDLKSGDYDEKQQILESQPSIPKLAQELFVFPEQKSHERLRVLAWLIQRDPELTTHQVHKIDNSQSEGQMDLSNPEESSDYDLVSQECDLPSDSENGQEPSSSSFGLISSNLKRKESKITSSCQDDNDGDEQPEAKRTILEASRAEPDDLLSEKLDRHSATAEEVNTKVDKIVIVQQLGKMMRSQEERIIEALMKRHMELQNKEEELMKRQMEILNKQEELMKGQAKLQSKEEELMMRQMEIQNKEEQLLKLKLKLMNKEEDAEYCETDGENEDSDQGEKQEVRETKPNVQSNRRTRCKK